MKKKIFILTLTMLALALTSCGDITINVPEGLLDKIVATGTPTPTQEPDEPSGTPDPTEEVTPTPTEKPTLTPTKEADQEKVFTTSEELWDKVFGCWAADNNRFVYFTYTDEGPSFLAGTWENPIPYNREAAVASETITCFGNGLYSIGITYPPNEENAADSQDLRPLGYTIMVDISMIENGVILVEAPEEEKMLEYTWMANSYSDAYDEITSFEQPTVEEVQNVWSSLSGFWISYDDTYVVFDQKDSNTFLFDTGRLASETRGYAELEKIQTPLEADPIRLIFCYPEHESELMGYLPREFVQVFLNIEDVDQGILHVKINESGSWLDYTYAGWSLE